MKKYIFTAMKNNSGLEMLAQVREVTSRRDAVSIDWFDSRVEIVSDDPVMYHDIVKLIERNKADPDSQITMNIRLLDV